jgi:hypothetical protein
MNQKINLSEWRTKEQICKSMGIGISTYKNRLNKLKNSPEFSGMTMCLSIDGKLKGITKSSVINRFFARKRMKMSEKDKLKKWSLKQNWHFFAHIVPPAIKEKELIEKSYFFSSRLKELYGKRTKVLFCIEDNPNDLGKGWVHAHILVKNKKLTVAKLKEEIELIFTYNYERRIEVERYDKEKWGDRGVSYCHKDHKERFFRSGKA